LPAKGFSSPATRGKLAPLLHLHHSPLSRFSPASSSIIPSPAAHDRDNEEMRREAEGQ